MTLHRHHVTRLFISLIPNQIVPLRDRKPSLTNLTSRQSTATIDGTRKFRFCALNLVQDLRTEVGIVTVLRPGPSLWQGREISLFFKGPRKVLGPTQPLIQWLLGAFSSRLKRPQHEADYRRASSAEDKNGWTYTYVPPICLRSVHRGT